VKRWNYQGLVRRFTVPLGGGSRHLFALDINNLRISLALMRPGKDGPVLERMHVERLEEYDNEGTPGLDPGQREAITKLVNEYRLAGVDTVASLPYKSYSIRVVVLPNMPRREVRNALRLDLKSNSKFNETTELFEFVTVDSFTQDGIRYENHLVATINRARLFEHVNFLRELGLNVKGFSVPALAGRNLLAHDDRIAADGVYAVVHMSHEETSFSLIRDHRLMFTREIPRTSRELSEALLNIVTPDGKTLHLDSRRASELMFEYGIIDDATMGETTDDGIPLEQVAVMMRPVLEKMLVEIRRSIDFCREQFGVPAPARLFLSGGNAQLKNLAHYLSSRLRIQTDFIDPTRGYTCATGDMREALSVRKHVLGTAIGSALNVSSGGQVFVPPEFIPRDDHYIKVLLRAVTATSFLLAASGVAFVHLSSVRTRGRMVQEQQTLNRLDSIEQRYAGAADKVKLRQFRHDTLMSLIGYDVPWGDVLRDLSRRIPLDVQLTEMVGARVPLPDKTFERRLKFKGVISLENDRVESVLSRLLDRLSASPYLDDVRLDTVTTSDERVASVQFSCRLSA